MLKIAVALLSASITVQAQAFSCFFTLVKDSCWTNYNVTVNVYDAMRGTQLCRVFVPKGKHWGREKFACQPGQELRFQAQFTPFFWEKDKNKVYPGQNYWILPSQIKNKETAWNITLCYASAFSEVPLPPDVDGNCRCDTQDVPLIKP